ncbi:uncharacterized protein LOC127512421 [Ctenopharyngodon idella]|uniref:uncharacterized protein LOC127512421 n=1 Tax=Ctenopharyngodon idella TaxID=7959 RepID=UPI0022329C22|nr:uncharacterized protein LOC127512421 [Ctenopharyngodon idella]
MRATHSKKVGTGSNKRPEKLNVHIRNSWRTNLQLIRSIGNMIGYKKSLSEWQGLSEVKMGRGSPIPPMLWRKIVEQFQKGVSQRKIAKSLKLSSSTVHNIIQRFRESGTISVRKGQGRKTILDARDLWALRRHCITCRNATVMEITTWAQEYFQKTLSVNTIRLVASGNDRRCVILFPVKTMVKSRSKSFCCVPQCSNSKQKQPYLSFHDFPSNAHQRKKWVCAIRRDEGPTFVIRRASTLVCSQHFTTADYIQGSCRLKVGVVRVGRFQWNNFYVPPQKQSAYERSSARQGVDVRAPKTMDVPTSLEVSIKDHDYAAHTPSR